MVSFRSSGLVVEIRGVDIHPASLFGTDPETGPQKVTEMVDLASKHNLNFLRPFVVGVRCDASYESRLMPIRVFEGWDPLKILVEEAHNKGLEVHPFICVVPQGVDQIGPTLKAHPEWAMVNKEGQVVGWGNPAHPEFRKYVVSIIMEIVRSYEIDGVSLDYLRYPGTKVDYSEYSRNRFREEYGVDPLELSEENLFYKKWNRWRIGQTDLLMMEIHDTVKEAKPEILLSAYVWTVMDPQICLRDWEAWLKKGYLDAVNPTGYAYEFSEYMKRIRASTAAARKASLKAPVFINVGVYTSHGSLKDAAQVIQWTQGAREAGADGVSFFTMKSLLPYLKEVSEALFKNRVKVPRRLI